jgi:3',5'-cyclic AMP phosphodiesterase CpdA
MAPVRLVSCVFLLLCFPIIATSATNNNDDGSLQWCRLPSPQEWSRPFFVAVVADPQIGWNKSKYNSEKLFREAATHLKRLQPDLILVAGDLIQTPSRESEYKTAKSILDDVGISYYAISGNHDVGSTPELKLLNEFVTWWNTPYYWFMIPYYNTLFVMLESNLLRSRENKKADQDVRQLAEEQLEWLNATLQEASESGVYDHIVPIAHHPLALKELDEKDRSQNTPREVRKDVIDIYTHYSDLISHVFAGHYHNSAQVTDNDSDIEYITYPSTGVILGKRADSGFALVQVNGQELKEHYYGYADMPRSRPEVDNAEFIVTFPTSQQQMERGSQVCITWTSTSMAKDVQLEYSLDDGDSWQVISEQSPNQGVFPWQVPTNSNIEQILVKVSSVHDSSIYGVSQEISHAL